MGQLLDAINAVYPPKQRKLDARIEVNEQEILAEDALVQLDKGHENAEEYIRKYYYPLKAHGGPLSKPFQRFLYIMSDYEDELSTKIEALFKKRFIEDWESIASGIVSEGDLKESPSYRVVLLNQSEIRYKRELVYEEAKDFLALLKEEKSLIFCHNFCLNNEDDYHYLVKEIAKNNEKKAILVQRVVDMSWQNLLGSSVATVIEAGIAMDINPDGTNRLAMNTTHGSRARPLERIMQYFNRSNALMYHPLIQQIACCGTFLGLLGRLSTAKAAMQKFAETGETTFYPALSAQMMELGIVTEHVEKEQRELAENKRAWEVMNQPVTGELCFRSSRKVLQSPYPAPVPRGHEDNPLGMCGMKGLFIK